VSLPRLSAAASLYTSRQRYRSGGAAGQTPTGVAPAAGEQCTAEGFFPAPNDCTRFYRCVNFDGTLTRFDFQCGPGTVYDPDSVTCVHPWQMPAGSPCRVE
jgi:hypothetical protein